MGSKTSLNERCNVAIRDIDETRRRIAARTERLQDRLKPRAILKPMTKRLQGTLGEGGEKILDAFRDNPVPLTLAGIGIGWLILNDVREERHRKEGTPAESETPSKAQEAAHKVKEAAGKVPEKVRQAATRVSDWFSETLEENPMIIAVAVLAAGMAAGLSIPASRREEETVGKLGESAAEKILEKGTEALEKREPAAPESAPSDAGSPAAIDEAKE